MKVVIGAPVFRRIKNRAFIDYPENYVAEPDVKILVQKAFKRSSKRIPPPNE